MSDCNAKLPQIFTINLKYKNTICKTQFSSDFRGFLLLQMADCYIRNFPECETKSLK